MKILVTGEHPTANTLRSLLTKQGLCVITSPPRWRWTPYYTINIRVERGERVRVDGVDSELERHIINGIAQLFCGEIILQRIGGVQSDRAITIGVPNDTAIQEAVELGCLRGLIWTIAGKGR